MSGTYHELPLDLALTRWSVVHGSWNALGGPMPVLSAFLAGWCLRCIGAEQPKDVGILRQSFLAGWHEADNQISIMARSHINALDRRYDGGDA